MMESSTQHLMKLAEESHDAAKGLISMGHPRFSEAQSYYTMFYLAQAVLLTKGLTFSSHSAVIAAYGKEFAKTGLLDPKFHRHMIRCSGTSRSWALWRCTRRSHHGTSHGIF
jgi:uncharacterized protein (UPF0332 family)